MGWAKQNSLTRATHETSPRAIAHRSSANAIGEKRECEFVIGALLSNANRLRSESDHCDKREDDEEGSHHELSEFERRLALCRRHRFQRGNFLERLHDSDKDIEIKRNGSADDINPVPRSGEVLCITGVYRDHKDDRRNDTKLDGRRNSVKWKKETRYRCCNRADEKPFRPAIDAIAGEKSKKNDKACKDGDQAHQRVNDRVDLQDHGLPIKFIFARNVTLTLFIIGVGQDRSKRWLAAAPPAMDP